MGQKVGRMTLALALIVIGAALIIDNLQNTRIAWYITHLWPALLILLGLEWILAAMRVPDGERIRVDGGAIVLLVIVAMLFSAFGSAWRAPFGPGRGPVPHFAVPEVTVPAIPGFTSISEEVVRTYDGDPGQLKELVVNAASGNITVRPGDAFKIDLHIRAYSWDKAQATNNANQVELQVTPGATTQVRATWPSNLSKLDLDFRITAPPGATLNLETSSGDVTIVDRDGAVAAHTASGNIEASGLKGAVDLRTSSGNITAKELGGNAVLTSASGNVEARSVKGSLKVGSSSGRVAVEDPQLDLSAQSSSGTVSVTAEQVGGNYDLTATSGRVHLTIPATAPVAVTARAASGTVSGPSWLVIGEGRNSASGSNGEGTYTVKLHTSSGSIDVDTR